MFLHQSILTGFSVRQHEWDLDNPHQKWRIQACQSFITPWHYLRGYHQNQSGNRQLLCFCHNSWILNAKYKSFLCNYFGLPIMYVPWKTFVRFWKFFCFSFQNASWLCGPEGRRLCEFINNFVDRFSFLNPYSHPCGCYGVVDPHGP